MSFLSELLYSTPALEAEDITDDVQQQTENALGGAKNTITKNDSEISLNTDDILGINEDPDGGDPGYDESRNSENNEESDSDNMYNLNDDEGTTGDLMNNDATNNSEELGNDSESGDNEFERTRKKKLWSNFKELYKVLDNSIDLITQYVPNISDVTTIKALGNIKDNLIDAKDLAYNTMTLEFQSLSYPQMQKRYVALNNIYDLITEELKVYFDKYKKI